MEKTSPTFTEKFIQYFDPVDCRAAVSGTTHLSDLLLPTNLLHYLSNCKLSVGEPFPLPPLESGKHCPTMSSQYHPSTCSDID